jgi:predicted S18 family serine protease
MSRATTCWKHCKELSLLGTGYLSVTGWIALLLMLLSLTVLVNAARAQGGVRDQLVPILGVTRALSPTGTVAYLVLSFEKRADQGGLAVHFQNGPGRFSQMAQTATEQAIDRTAHALGLSTDSWTVVLSVPYQGATMYGDSLSAMVALSVVALAQGAVIPRDRVITGTVTPDGLIGPVGGIPLKVTAAQQAHLRMVLVPDKPATAEGNWEASSSMQVSQVDSVSHAYQALTAPQSSLAGSVFLVSAEHRY